MALASGGIWRSLDLPLQLAFQQAWEAFQSGSIGVGAVASAPDGSVVVVGRNRVGETDAPPGQLAGTSLAHAEMNVIAQLPFRHPRELVLTTTLQPCLQCAAAIRMAPVALVRYAGSDLLWDGCGDFSALSPWLRRRPAVPTEGPSGGEIGLFATMVARFGPGLIPAVEDGLRQVGEGALLDLVHELESDGWCERARSEAVQWALDDVWPALQQLARQ